VGLVANDRNYKTLGLERELQRRDGNDFAGSASFRLLNDTDSTAEYILEREKKRANIRKWWIGKARDSDIRARFQGKWLRKNCKKNLFEHLVIQPGF